MNKHVTTVHARCPYLPIWDYYTVTLETETFLRCEKFQELCDAVRGIEATQEDVFKRLQASIKIAGKLTIEGRHGQNGVLIISDKTLDCPFPGSK